MRTIPTEICICGHTDAEHADHPIGTPIEVAVELDYVHGQGDCLNDECACEQFTWACFFR